MIEIVNKQFKEVEKSLMWHGYKYAGCEYKKDGRYKYKFKKNNKIIGFFIDLEAGAVSKQIKAIEKQLIDSAN